MSKREKIVTFFIIIAISFGFILQFLPKNVGSRASAASAAAPLSYAYMMSAPLAVATDDGSLYVLDRYGNVAEVTDGMRVAVKRAGASKLAVGGGKIVTDTETDSVAVFAVGYAAEMTADAFYIGEGENRTLAIEAGENRSFKGGALHGDTLYAAVDTGSRLSLFAYDLAHDNAKTLIKNEIKTDGELTAMAVAADGTVYYATDYSLYTLGSSRGAHVGGIVSLAADGDELYYATRSGEVCLYAGGKSTTVLAASEKVTVTTRKNFAVFADKGNNMLTMLTDGATLTAETETPVGVAVDYAGNVYAASENRVKIFTRSLEYVGAEADMIFGGADDPIAEIKADPSNVTGCTIYALSESGTLRRSTDDRTASGIARVEISADGMIYAMKTDGSVVILDDDMATETPMLAGGDYVDFALDQGANVYRAAADGVYAGDADEPCYRAEDVTEIAVSMVSLTGSGKAVAYGDLIVITASGCANVIVPRDTAGTDMRDDADDAEYKAFMEAADDPAPHAADYNIEIRKAETASDVYDFPAETPVGAGREVKTGDNVIVIARYGETTYFYAIAETPAGPVKGFVNLRTLSAPLPYDTVYDSETCAPIKTASIYKYPSQIAPLVGETALSNAYKLLPFTAAYRDASGREWCRIAFTDGDGSHDGYVLRTNVSINGHTGGYNKDLLTDAVIKADEETVKTYIDEAGAYELGTIANGTPVKLEESFNKSREFTKISFVSDTETGATTTCYVRTEYIKHTEAGWYQVIFFVVGGVVVVAIAVIIVIRIRKKRRID